MHAAQIREETDILFEQAVTEHCRRLLTVARAIVGNRVSPEDVVQQAMMNLYEHRSRYDWEEPGPLMPAIASTLSFAIFATSEASLKIDTCLKA